MTNDHSDLVLSEHPIFSQEIPPEAEVVTPPEDDEAQYLINLTWDRRNLQQQLLDFVNQDPDAKIIYNRSVGNQAAKRYQPRIQELESHVENYRRLLARDRMASMTEEEINERFQRDPEFARQYAELAHADIQEPQTQVDMAAVERNIVGGIQRIVGAGQRNGLTEQDMREIAQNMRNGAYDKDETGTDLPPSMWQEVLDNLQDDVTARIVRNRTGGNNTPPVEAPTTTPPPPSRVDTARPDMSSAGIRGVRNEAITNAQFRQMRVDDQQKLLESWYPDRPEDTNLVSRAVSDGKITLEDT